MAKSVAQSRFILLLLVFLLLFLINHKWVRPPIKSLQSAKRSVVVNTFRNPSDPMCIDQPPPAVKEATDGIHYDVTLCLNDAWNEIITTHWLHTLPLGVQAFYPDLAPQIFFHGRDTDPFDDLERDGYLHDSGGFHSLWTVGTLFIQYSAL